MPFHVVVEPQEADAYAAAFGEERVLVLPFSDLGLGPIPARNWLWEHAREQGAERHWSLNDNILGIARNYGGKRVRCPAGPALAGIKDFVDRYENIAMGSLHHSCFGFGQQAAFRVNTSVYSCMLIRNDLPHRWRGRLNEDTDLSLQVLADGWCTVNVNAFVIRKVVTMAMAGGNTDELYQGDGRLTMAKELQRRWPHVTTITRKYGRPQHHIAWRKFDTPLKLKPDIDLAAVPPNGRAAAGAARRGAEPGDETATHVTTKQHNAKEKQMRNPTSAGVTITYDEDLGLIGVYFAPRSRCRRYITSVGYLVCDEPKEVQGDHRRLGDPVAGTTAFSN